MTAKKYIAYDTETTGLDPYRGARIFAWSTCDEDGKTAVSRFKEDAVEIDSSKAQLQKLLDNTSTAKVCHNFHFDYAVTLASGFNVPADTEWHCTLIICKLLNNLENSNSLDDLAFNYGGYTKDQDMPVSAAARIYGSYDKIPKKIMEEYQHADAERTMLLFKVFYPYIQKDKKLYEEYLNELETVKTTIRMEMRGLMLCKTNTKKLTDWVDEELSKVEKDSLRLIPSGLNLSSPKQLVSLLYDELKFPILAMNKSGMAPATDKDALENLRKAAESNEYEIAPEALDILDLILRQRSYVKGKGMLQSYIDATGENGIIHPHINTNAARTGRESSENPNMQNISKETALKTKYTIPARRCFRARPQHVLFLLDYSGIEMRLAVQATGSHRLIKLLDEDFDFHDACAKSFYGTRYLEAEPKTKKALRSAAKNGRFAMLYGAGIKQVARTCLLTMEEATDGVERDKKEFPEFYWMMDQCISEARKYGFVNTFFGRRLRVNPKQAYIATDYKIQGSAAALFKRAQVSVDRYFRDEWNDEIALWLPVHDELIIEMPRKFWAQRETILNDIIDRMIYHDEITVNLNAEVKMSTLTWADAKEFPFTRRSKI